MGRGAGAGGTNPAAPSNGHGRQAGRQAGGRAGRQAGPHRCQALGLSSHQPQTLACCPFGASLHPRQLHLRMMRVRPRQPAVPQLPLLPPSHQQPCRCQIGGLALAAAVSLALSRTSCCCRCCLPGRQKVANPGQPAGFLLLITAAAAAIAAVLISQPTTTAAVAAAAAGADSIPAAPAARAAGLSIAGSAALVVAAATASR